MAQDGGIHIGILKGQVSAFHGAVDQGQVLAVAQGLGADDAAVFQGQILGEPAQVLALDDGVRDECRRGPCRRLFPHFL